MALDLITHIPGITNSGSFTPGANTPAPWNAAATGAVDGTGPASATKNMAEIYNRFLLERAALIQRSGLTVDNTNWAQMGDAIAKMIAAGSGGNGSTSAPVAYPSAMMGIPNQAVSPNTGFTFQPLAMGNGAPVPYGTQNGANGFTINTAGTYSIVITGIATVTYAAGTEGFLAALGVDLSGDSRMVTQYVSTYNNNAGTQSPQYFIVSGTLSLSSGAIIRPMATSAGINAGGQVTGFTINGSMNIVRVA